MTAARSQGGVRSNLPPGRPALFILVGLAPMLLLYGTLLFGALLSLLLSLGSAAPGSDGLLGLPVLAMGLVLAPALVMLALARLLGTVYTWVKRGLLLYLALDLLSIGLLFTLQFGLGGASMAAVEEAVGMRGLAAGATLETAIWILAAQFLIVPWVSGVTAVASRLTGEEDTRDGWN